MRLEPTILAMTATRSVHRANWDSDGQMIKKCTILFVMSRNLQLVREVIHQF